MKKLLINTILPTFALLLTVNSSAQITQGGKELPDEVVVKVDTLTRTKTYTITTPENTSGQYFAIYYSFANPNSALSGPPQAGSSYDDVYQGKTGMGMKTGWRFGFEGNILLAGINKNMIRELDWGINLLYEFGGNSFTFEGYPNSGDIYTEPNTTYTSFFDISVGGLGPTLTYHTPIDGLDVDILANFGLNMVGGGGVIVDDRDNDVDHEIENVDGLIVTAYRTFGVNFRYNPFYLSIKSKSYNVNDMLYNFYDYNQNFSNQGSFVSQLGMKFTNISLGFAF